MPSTKRKAKKKFFGGKRYRRKTFCLTREAAEKEAKELRKKHLSVRIDPRPAKTDKRKTIYWIYIRRKK